MKSIISDLHVKFAEKTWSETFQLVRRCMDKSRDESKPCEPLVRSLERLRGALNVSSMNAMRSRLEAIAKQRGMGFHATESTCYLTADLFYLEVLLLPCGEVDEVKVAPHGGSPVSSEAFLKLLRSKQFAQFSVKLEGVFTQYNIPGDTELQLKLFTSLQCLGKDLEEMSRWTSDLDVETINEGRVGRLTAAKEDCPLNIQLYMVPTGTSESSVQAAQVAVITTDVPHRLQMAPVIPLPLQLDPQGHPVFTPLTEMPHEMLPACFLLKLQPSVPMMMSFVNKIRQITDVTVPNVDLQGVPFPHLLLSSSSGKQEAVFTVPLPGDVTHRYIFPGAASPRGTVIDSIPFTHPAHVPALVELLRHQCAINALLRSCTSASPESSSEQYFEILLESDSSFSVTFQRPDLKGLAVLLVDVSSAQKMTCSLFGAGNERSSLDEYLSALLKRCMSIPLTLQELLTKLEQTNCTAVPEGRVTPAPAEDDQSAPTGATAAVPEDTIEVSACCTASVASTEPAPEINLSPAVNLYPSAPVAVFSQPVTAHCLN